MGTRDARVSAYVARAAPFAQPILSHVRELVHTACPGVSETAMGQFGRITKLGDLPRDATLKALIRKAVALNESGIKPARVVKPKAAPLHVPDDLAAALMRNRIVRASFDAMSPSHRREYIEWLVDAKRPETRSKRLATAIEWIGQGKSREWKYRGR